MRECDTPYCIKLIPKGRLKRAISGYHFCKECRTAHSYRVLVAQAEHKMPIREILLEASIFGSAGDMAAYVGVSFVTVYHWITKYFNLTFQEFRRQYICKKKTRSRCYLLDIKRSSYSRHDYVLKKIRSKRYCACINALEQDLIMTDAPLDVIQSIWRGSPRIQQISDDLFALVPSPVKFRKLFPVYFDLVEKVEKSPPKKREKSKRRKAPPRPPGAPRFFEKVLMALQLLGGSARVADLCQNLTNIHGEHPRKNNTRREVYKHPEVLEFLPEDDQSMRLTKKGKEVAARLLVDQGKSADH